MKPPFTITEKMINLIVEITEKITRVEIEKERNLHLRKTNRIRSIHSSLAIEQNSLSLEQVTDVINGKLVIGDLEDIREVQNAYQAYGKVFQLSPYSVKGFLTAHKLLTQDLLRESGAFRMGDVGVYDAEGKVIHVGARPQYVNGLISDLFTWAKEATVHELIKSCVVHFEIEMIHPFPDGNGRMGRLWQNLILSQWHPIFEWIPIETIIYANQQKYYDALGEGDKANDSQVFIEFILDVISQTLSDIENQELSDKLSDILSDKVLDKLNDKEKDFVRKIYPHLKENKEIGNSKAVQLSDIPSATVRRYLKKLVELEVLTSKGENRNRKYLLKD
ncbi:MAG: Fic family protein [Streptococcaceae bacterium]|nr:Fic family protein [Streptococcaceae bacterium]MCL2680912.1 Fic family protein [Streptococcaceae bacterium]